MYDQKKIVSFYYTGIINFVVSCRQSLQMVPRLNILLTLKGRNIIIRFIIRYVLQKSISLIHNLIIYKEREFASKQNTYIYFCLKIKEIYRI